jgi:hypothetical protein
MDAPRRIRPWLLVPAVLSVASCAPPAPGSLEEKRQREFALEIDAQVFAEKCVRKCLKYPHDASFGWGTNTAKNAEGNLWSVKGTVKARNAFGADLSHDWLVILERRGENWDLLSCVIGDETAYISDRLTELLAAKQDADRPTNRSSVSERSGIPTEAPSLPRPSAPRAPAPVASPPVPPSDVADRPIPTPAPPIPRDDKRRTWTDASGQFSIEAEFAGMSFGVVKLRKADGEIIEIQMDRLADEDQDWVRRRGR